MSALRFLDDEAIEALTLGDDVVPELAALAAFADHVRAVGDRPAPSPSLELRALFASQAAGKADRAVRARSPRAWIGSAAAPRGAQERLASVAGKVAGLGIAAKIALGVSVATAGVASAGAVGALPDGADRAVRSAIEAVTPLDLWDADDGQGHGPDRSTTGPGSTREVPAGTSTTPGSAGDPAGAGAPAGELPAGTATDGGWIEDLLAAHGIVPGPDGQAPGEAGAENSESGQLPNGEGRDRGERWDGDGVLTPEAGGTPAATATTTPTTTATTLPSNTAPSTVPDTSTPDDQGTGKP